MRSHLGKSTVKSEKSVICDLLIGRLRKFEELVDGKESEGKGAQTGLGRMGMWGFFDG